VSGTSIQLNNESPRGEGHGREGDASTVCRGAPDLVDDAPRARRVRGRGGRRRGTVGRCGEQRGQQGVLDDGGRRPRRGVAPQEGRQERPQGRRVARRRRGHVARHDQAHQSGQRRGGKGAPPAHQLVQHAAEGPHVGFVVVRKARTLPTTSSTQYAKSGLK